MASKNVSLMMIRKRLVVCFFILVAMLLTLIGRLAWIQLVQAEELGNEAWKQWNRTIPASSPRGTIYDRQGKVLAGSATAESVLALPAQVDDPTNTATILAQILEMDQERVYDLITSERATVYIKRQLPEKVTKEIRERNLPGITFTQESKRFYPNNKLASQVLGFVGVDQGWSGLESYYESLLKGKDGRVVFQSDAWGRRIPQGVQRYIPPESGYDLFLTIDETFQHVLERELDAVMREIQPENAQAIAINPQTGEILALASKPDFDPNNYMDFPQETWKISPISDTFEPGSTFKLVTLAAAIEENQYRIDEDFFCSGSINVAGQRIRCWTASTGGHGAINFLEAVLGSCNPAFVTLGQRLGVDSLFDYITAFGFGENTRIDLPGENSGILFQKDRVGPVELATTSFGQGVSVTPIQQVMAVAAIINGGNLLEPYIVSQVVDQEGNLVAENTPEIVRQAISASTSELVREVMEEVALEGSGRNAQVPGYRIGAKTGTAQKVGPTGGYIQGEHILSFVGYLPAENPQVLVYIAVDSPARGPQWGGQVSAPIFKYVMTDMVKHLNITPSEQVDGENISMVIVPDMTGLDIEQAGFLADNDGLAIRTVGAGARVANQIPKTGAMVSVGSRILLYMEDAVGELVLMPDLTGYTMREAAEILNWLELKMETRGSGMVVSQSIKPGEEVPPGALVTLEFNSSDS